MQILSVKRCHGNAFDSGVGLLPSVWYPLMSFFRDVKHHTDSGRGCCNYRTRWGGAIIGKVMPLYYFGTFLRSEFTAQ